MIDICPSRDDAQPHLFEGGRCSLCLTPEGARRGPEFGKPIRLVCPTCQEEVGTTDESLDQHEYWKHGRPSFDGRYTADIHCKDGAGHRFGQWCPTCKGYA